MLLRSYVLTVTFKEYLGEGCTLAGETMAAMMKRLLKRHKSTLP
jgi:hypothetical protein